MHLTNTLFVVCPFASNTFHLPTLLVVFFLCIRGTLQLVSVGRVVGAVPQRQQREGDIYHLERWFAINTRGRFPVVPPPDNYSLEQEGERLTRSLMGRIQH